MTPIIEAISLIEEVVEETEEEVVVLKAGTKSASDGGNYCGDIC